MKLRPLPAGDPAPPSGEAAAPRVVDVADIEAVVAKMARAPVQAVSSDDRTALRHLDDELKQDDLRPGRGDRRRGVGDPAGALGAARARQADRQLPLHRSDRRRQDRAGAAAGPGAARRVPALRHVGVHGEARRVAPDRRAARLRRLRGRRAAHRRRAPVAARGAAPRRDREGASGSLQHPAAGDGSRDADRHPRPQGRLPPRHPDHDDQRRGPRPVGAQDGFGDAGEGSKATGVLERVFAPGVPQPPRRHGALQGRSAATRSAKRRRQARRRAAGSGRRARRSPSRSPTGPGRGWRRTASTRPSAPGRWPG